jgi:hypothetical protein
MYVEEEGEEENSLLNTRPPFLEVIECSRRHADDVVEQRRESEQVAAALAAELAC